MGKCFIKLQGTEQRSGTSVVLMETDRRLQEWGMKRARGGIAVWMGEHPQRQERGARK